MQVSYYAQVSKVDWNNIPEMEEKPKVYFPFAKNKKCVIRIVGGKEVPQRYLRDLEARDNFINVTSRSKKFGTEFSPFFLGPLTLYDDYKCENMENAWQYAKVYKEYTDENGDPTPDYFKWAKSGWDNPKAVRFPMGRGAKPEYSYWEGGKYLYVPARKRIYAPLYANEVVKRSWFDKLKKITTQHKYVMFWDFDGYDHLKYGYDYEHVLNNPKRKMGHAFVLAMLLDNQKLWEVETTLKERKTDWEEEKRIIKISPSLGETQLHVHFYNPTPTLWNDELAESFSKHVTAKNWRWLNHKKDSLVLEFYHLEVAELWVAKTRLTWDEFKQCAV